MSRPGGSTADRGWLHLEARFNYEDRDTGSAWLGYNFSVGERLTLANADGRRGLREHHRLRAGLQGLTGLAALEFYTETEYVFDTGDSADSFLYTWSELALAPADWCRFGLAVPRTKAYKTEFDIQRGFLAGFSYRRLDVTAYVFNPDASRPTVVLGVVAGF